MASTVTTFAIFKSLLTQSVAANPSLDAATRAAMNTRISELANEDRIVLDQPKVQSVGGNVSEDTANGSINVALGVPGSPNRVEFDPLTYLVPVRVDGTKGIRGFLPGHAGTSVLPLVAQADISLQYRTSATAAWTNFDRTTVVDEVTWIQFAATIATQLANGSVPAINIHAEQV